MGLSMSHYDDLQRFKEKTRTQRVEFKDLSSQSSAREQGDWVILNQLSPPNEASSLAIGGSVSLHVPQSVDASLFKVVKNEPTPK